MMRIEEFLDALASGAPVPGEEGPPPWEELWGAPWGRWWRT